MVIGLVGGAAVLALVAIIVAYHMSNKKSKRY